MEELVATIMLSVTQPPLSTCRGRVPRKIDNNCPLILASFPLKPKYFPQINRYVRGLCIKIPLECGFVVRFVVIYA